MASRRGGSWLLALAFAVALGGLTFTGRGVAAQHPRSALPRRAAHFFPIGKPGVPWGDSEKAEWLATRKIQRSYKEEVLDKVTALDPGAFEVLQYGALELDKDRYPLFAVKLKNWQAGRPNVFVTGGVHGYEKSGVQGVIRFLKELAPKYAEKLNIAACPCVSPWGYETIQRWNCKAVDPNRSFNPDGEVVEGRSFNPEAATEESKAVIAFLESLKVEQWLCHIDCHETTDTDESEFRPAKSARDGEEYKPDGVPDGFYLVVDGTQIDAEWNAAMINSVKTVTHIAPPDTENKIIGEEVIAEGIIAVPAKPRDLGLAMGVTNAMYAATTEVYPDSPKATEEECERAQVACLVGALDHLIKVKGL